MEVRYLTRIPRGENHHMDPCGLPQGLQVALEAEREGRVP